MQKIVIFSILAGGMLFVGQPAWANGGYDHHDDEFRVFRKIVHILNDVINDDFGHRGRVVVVQREHYPRRIHKIRHRRGHHYYRGHHGWGQKYRYHYRPYKKVCKLGH